MTAAQRPYLLFSELAEPPLHICKSPSSGLATGFAKELAMGLVLQAARRALHVFDEAFRETGQIASALAAQQAVAQRPGVFQLEHVQRIRTAVACGASARHHRDARPGPRPCGIRLRNCPRARAGRCACPGRWRCLPERSGWRCRDGCRQTDRHPAGSAKCADLGCGQGWSSEVTTVSSSRNSGVTSRPDTSILPATSPRSPAPARIAITISPDIFFFELHVHVRVFRKKRGQRVGQERVGRGGVGQQAQAALSGRWHRAAGSAFRHSSWRKTAFACLSSTSPAGVSATPVAMRTSRRALKASSMFFTRALAAGKDRKVRSAARGQIECFPHVQEQTQVGQVVSHVPPRRRGAFLILNSSHALSNLPWCIPSNQSV
jgi:hypothetical protein